MDYKFLDEIHTERLILRPFRLDDSQEVANLCNNKKIYDMTLNLPYPYTYEDGYEWIKYLYTSFDLDRSVNFAITDKEDRTLYGCVGAIISQVHKRAEIGYWLGEDYWNQGIMTEAVIYLIDFLFTKRNLHKVYGEHFVENEGSRKVMEKAGMVREGTFRDHILKNGSYKDLVINSIINVWEDKEEENE